VQECVRLLLEAVYESGFARTSHGFRPNHSCHTALSQMQVCFTGVKWFIEGDIKGFFDNINNEVMVGILAERIKDERFLRLIRKFLKAGYLEDWQYHNTYSGTPQGGIISPILANIYLDKLDRHMEELKKRFDKGTARSVYPETYELEKKRGVLAKKLRNANSEEERGELAEKIREIDRKKLTMPYSDSFDTSFRRLQYVRYADDFLIGVIGNKEDAILIDAGINCKQILNRMKAKGLDPLNIRAIFITHEHNDHVCGARVIAKKLDIPVYMTKGTYHALYITNQPDAVRFIDPVQPVIRHCIRKRRSGMREAVQPVRFILCMPIIKEIIMQQRALDQTFPVAGNTKLISKL